MEQTHSDSQMLRFHTLSRVPVIGVFRNLRKDKEFGQRTGNHKNKSRQMRVRWIGSLGLADKQL